MSYSLLSKYGWALFLIGRSEDTANKEQAQEVQTPIVGMML